MKKIFTLTALVFVALSMNAQVFWTENFGQGCDRGQLAGAYTGPNGTWAINTTGTNDPFANEWFVSASAAGTAVNTCSSNCITSTNLNRTLHIGNPYFNTGFGGSNADTGSTYLTGFFCTAFSICSVTNKRAQSPTINCTGKTNITLSCLYYEGGQLADFATLVFSADGGVTWSNVNAMSMTVNTSCTPGSGKWAAYSVALPASANNNANVKVGFNWTNDNTGGADPSFAVDDITLSQSPTGINEISALDLSIYASDNNIIIKTDNAYKLIAVTDMLGNAVRFTQTGNTISMNEHSTGIYFVQVEMNGTRVTKKVFVQ